MRTTAEIETALLCDLTDAELDHVSLGLCHSFGAVIIGKAGAEVMYLRGEYATPVVIDTRTVTVSGIWRAAEDLS